MPRKAARGITSRSKDLNVTTGRRFSVRLTDNEKVALQCLVTEMRKRLPKKRITMSRVLRATTHLEGEQALRALAKAVCKIEVL